MPKGIKITEATWIEIKEIFEKSWPVIIPLGAACKEHGLHLPMNTEQVNFRHGQSERLFG